jgi:hypothetical protein
MQKKPEVDGAWLELQFTDLTKENVELMKGAKCIVLNDIRIELSGEDVAKFIEKYINIRQGSESEMTGMTEQQKSFYVTRKMLLS